jgi:hypothetical protein
MDRIQESRIAWQRAQVELEVELAKLEHVVASRAGPDEIEQARAKVTARQKETGEMLQRHITQLGKG